MMGGGKKKNGKTNGKETNGTKANGAKPNGAAKNGYKDTFYLELGEWEHVKDMEPGDRFIARLPVHPSGAAGIWDIENPDQVKVTKKTDREWVIEAIAPIKWVSGFWDNSNVVFTPINPQTNEAAGQHITVQLVWAGEPDE